MTEPSHSIGFLMDPYESLNLATETSLLCMDELIGRGHQVYWIEQHQISLANGSVSGYPVRVESTSPFLLKKRDTIDIVELDALIIRKDPPFDRSYLHLTYLLEFLPQEVIQINSPVALRNINEKLYTLRFPDYCPDTLVSQDIERLTAFLNRHNKIVLKPLDDCSGRGIQFAQADDDDLSVKINSMLEKHGYLMAQEFLPEIKKGDKRVYLVNGLPVGWVNRIPAPGSDLANIHQGAVCMPSELTAKERLISQTVGEVLVKQHILLAGLDFIDERLTEINVTSPSAVRQINEVNNTQMEGAIVDAILSLIPPSPIENRQMEYQKSRI